MSHKKYAIELRTHGTLPFAWWITEKGKDVETAGRMIPPPTSFTVRAYRNYCAQVIKKYRLPIKITFRKPKGYAIVYRIDNEPEDTMFAPAQNVIPRPRHGNGHRKTEKSHRNRQKGNNPRRTG